MDTILKIIKTANPDNKNITNSTYARRMRTIMPIVDIKDTKATMSYIKKYYTEKTFKSFLTSLVIYTRAIGLDEIEKVYGDELKIVNERIQEKEKTQVATEAEKSNMISSKDIQNLIKYNKNLLDNMQIKEGYYEYFDTYKKYLVLNLYSLIPPVRNDYVGCEVYKDPISFPDLTKNYIYTDPKLLVLNRYKTSKSYGEGNEIDLPKKLVEIIENWFKIRTEIYPILKDNNELLLNKNLKPMSQVSLTQFLNRIFGKNISSTMLRKSYLSEKYPVTYTRTEMEKDAKSMQHSVRTQQQTYRKKTT